MTIEDIVKLIEVCKNAGVRKIKFEKLEVKFFPRAADTQARAVPVSHENREIETIIEADQDLNDLELQNLMINDPIAYEDFIRKQGNVEDS